MFAIISAVLFAIALVLDIANVRVGPLTAGVFIAAGLLCLALEVAGVWNRRGASVTGSRK